MGRFPKIRGSKPNIKSPVGALGKWLSHPSQNGGSLRELPGKRDWRTECRRSGMPHTKRIRR